MPDKPIILIGGTNGAGKTTLFESVMLCLYGITSMGKQYTKRKYHQFLSKKIHRYVKGTTQADFASITVQFKFFHAGRETEYQVNRTWNKIDGSLDERLRVQKRHAENERFQSLDTVEEFYWQSFIKDLIPKGVVNMFFFDGEKVVEIAKDAKEDFAIKKSFKSLLGLDIIEQLHTDLQVNLVRNLTRGGSRLRDEYEKYKTEKKEYGVSNARLAERLAQKQNELDRIQGSIESIESSVSRIGGEFSIRRDSAKESLAVKRIEYDHVKKSIQENCSDYLPFSLIPSWLSEVKSTIKKDQQILQDMLSAEAVASEIASIQSYIKSNKLWKGLELDNRTRKIIQEKIESLLDSKITPKIKDKVETFGFSSTQISRILQAIDSANGSALEQLTTDTQKIITISEEIQILERTLTSAANDDEVGRLISEIGNMNRQSGEINSEMNHIREKMASNSAMRVHLDTKMHDVVTQMYKDEKSKTKVKLTQDVQSVLEEFLEKIKIIKLKLLEKHLLENTQLLMRKKSFVEQVKIDTDTFRVNLFGPDGNRISKTMLSEGEKQMFATSILWALARTSGKPLPFMIDTPLARLDEEHRMNIIKKFFPLASHQIIIFSTDKEIEQEHYRLLEQYVTRSYLIEFSEVNGSTKVRKGYFWNKKGEKVTALQ